MTGYCEHSSVESAAPAAPAAPAVEAPSTSNDPGSFNESVAESIVDNNFNQAEIARFCVAVEQVGYDAARRAFKSVYSVGKLGSIQAVFREIVHRCP